MIIIYVSLGNAQLAISLADNNCTCYYYIYWPWHAVHLLFLSLSSHNYLDRLRVAIKHYHVVLNGLCILVSYFRIAWVFRRLKNHICSSSHLYDFLDWLLLLLFAVWFNIDSMVIWQSQPYHKLRPLMFPPPLTSRDRLKETSASDMVRKFLLNYVANFLVVLESIYQVLNQILIVLLNYLCMDVLCSQHLKNIAEYLEDCIINAIFYLETNHHKLWV